MNYVMKSLRGKIDDMELDPVNLKKERDHWKHEAKALKMQLLKFKEDRNNWKQQANFFRLERDELKVRLEQFENNKSDNFEERNDDYDDAEMEVDANVERAPEENVVVGEENGVIIQDNIVVHEADVQYELQVPHEAPQAEEGLQAQGASHAVPLGCKVAFDEFELFVKFKQFLAAEAHGSRSISHLAEPQEDAEAQGSRSISHGAEPVPDAGTVTVTPPASQGCDVQQIKPAVSVEGCKTFVALPDGRVVEMIDIGPF